MLRTKCSNVCISRPEQSTGKGLRKEKVVNGCEESGVCLEEKLPTLCLLSPSLSCTHTDTQPLAFQVWEW